jgi:hypothetical protein
MLRSQSLAWIQLRIVALTLLAESYSMAISHIPALIICSGQDQGCHADVFGRTDGRTDGRSDDGRGGVRDLDAL